MEKNISYKNRYLRNRLESFNKTEKLEFLLSLSIDKKDHSGLAKKLLKKYESFNDIIDEEVEELKVIPGFKEDYLIGLKLPHDFANFYLNEKMKNRPHITNPSDIYNYLRHTLQGKKKEQFNVMYLNSRNEITNDEVLFNGTVNQAAVFPREIMKSAIKYDASGIIIAHNHPSGNPEPSQSDIKITDQIDNASKLLDITLLDHIIIAGDKYTSFVERRLL